MNPTTRAIVQSVLTTDGTLTGAEKSALQRVLSGLVEAPANQGHGEGENLLISQKKAAKLLDVSRVTVWRMTKESVLHPVELLPGTWRYPYLEIAQLARRGMPAVEDASGQLAVA